jgi:hypothetical protein
MGGCVVLDPALKAFAKVAPNGQVTELVPPLKRFLFHQIDNKPSARYGECACRNYHDPESGEPWGNRDKERGLDIHHPFCQGREGSIQAYSQSYERGMDRLGRGLNPQARPDEWLRTIAEVTGR